MSDYTFWTNLSNTYFFKINLCLFCALAQSTGYVLKALNKENIFVFQRALKDPL